MKCYICAKQGQTSDAVAICIVCGMGLCMQHVVRDDLPLTRDTAAGLGFHVRTLPEKLPRILCPPCHSALTQNG